MAVDFPSATFLAFYIISVHVLHTNSRTSTHWKLNAQSGKVEVAPMVAAGRLESEMEGDGSLFSDPLLNILVSSHLSMKDGEWRIEANPGCYERCSSESNRVADSFGENNTVRYTLSIISKL